NAGGQPTYGVASEMIVLPPLKQPNQRADDQGDHQQRQDRQKEAERKKSAHNRQPVSNPACDRNTETRLVIWLREIAAFGTGRGDSDGGYRGVGFSLPCSRH